MDATDKEASTSKETKFQNVITSPVATQHENGKHEKKHSEKLKLKTADTDKRYLISDSSDTLQTPSISDLRRANCWRTSAVLISWVSIVASLAIGIAEFVVAQAEDSAAAFGLAFSAILDVLSSGVVVWRFYKANDTFSQRREHISCVVLGGLFIVSALGIAVKAIFDLAGGNAPDLSENGLRFLVSTSIVAACVCFVLFLCKAIIARQLASWTILTDALNSLMGMVIALSLITTSEITKSNPTLWFLDSTVGLTVSVFLLVYGLWLISKLTPQLLRGKSYNQTT